ncbi:MAG: 5'/3'-nucleotidase SurE [Candidatus Izemoplasmataceae bacterium]
MIILLTNDDGIQSKKLKFAKVVLEKYGKVYTVAPAEEQSAKSMSLSIGGFKVNKINDQEFSVEGTPVDCVNFALGGLNLRPDLVVSGINDGYNLGFDTKYSGTVGACLQAQYFGFNTVAFSSDRKGFRMVESEFEKTFEYIINKKMYSGKYTLNVNFPREKFEKSNGLLDNVEVFHHEYEYKPELIDGHYYPNRRIVINKELPEKTDAYGFHNGYTTISKITI